DSRPRYPGAAAGGVFSAAGGRLVVEVADAFRARYPDCEVRIREVHFSDGIGPLLHAGELDLLLSIIGEPGLTASPVLFRARCLLAVSARHRFAGRDFVALADVGQEVVLSLPPPMPDYWAETLAPRSRHPPCCGWHCPSPSAWSARCAAKCADKAGLSTLRRPGPVIGESARAPALGRGEWDAQGRKIPVF